jgi:hypothetical protein
MNRSHTLSIAGDNLLAIGLASMPLDSIGLIQSWKVDNLMVVEGSRSTKGLIRGTCYYHSESHSVARIPKFFLKPLRKFRDRT